MFFTKKPTKTTEALVDEVQSLRIKVETLRAEFDSLKTQVASMRAKMNRDGDKPSSRENLNSPVFLGEHGDPIGTS